VNVLSIKPEWGVNFDLGYIGFTFNDKSFVSNGIAFFEHWDRYSGIPVSHCLIVTGWDACIEALPQGVVNSDLGKYFDDPHTRIFFRKPKGWNYNIAMRMTDEAGIHVGEKYGYCLLFSHAVAATLPGRILNLLTFNLPNKALSAIFDERKKQICSELAAKAIAANPDLKGKGVLKKPPRMITPQMLFEDNEIFEPWKWEASQPSAKDS